MAMKMQKWMFYECNSNTWRIKRKRDIYVQSNLDIIMTKNIDKELLEVNFLAFDQNLSDHK